ncbi:MAG: zf-TFIIB domain-containing protein [Candidatus Binatia bacterium]
MQCPKCATETLSPWPVQTIEVDRCTTCGGVWCDDQELPLLLRVSSQELKPLQKGPERDDLDTKRGVCPRDATPLIRVFSAQNSSVVVDACSQCRGVWLDGGELSRLLQT